jgi:hypothetical protein
MKTNLNSTLTQPAATDHTPRLVALGLLAGILIILALTGCHGAPRADCGAAAGVFTQCAGVYQLVSVNGNPVPCLVSHENADITVKSGTMTINPDGTCRSDSVFSLPHQREINRVVAATYTVTGSELTMHWQGAGTTRGTVNGHEFTMNNEGMIFIYRK